jgi:hypothetical protein
MLGSSRVRIKSPVSHKAKRPAVETRQGMFRLFPKKISDLLQPHGNVSMFYQSLGVAIGPRHFATSSSERVHSVSQASLVTSLLSLSILQSLKNWPWSESGGARQQVSLGGRSRAMLRCRHAV